MTIKKTAGNEDFLQFLTSTGIKHLSVDYTGQLAFQVGASGPVYFGNFNNANGGRAGFSTPLQVIMGIDAATHRFGMGGSGTYFVGNAPAALLEVRGKANELQLAIQSHSTQTANLTEWRNSGGTALSVVNNAGSFGIGTSTITTSYSANNKLMVAGGATFAPPSGSDRVTVAPQANLSAGYASFLVISPSTLAMTGGEALSKVHLQNASSSIPALWVVNEGTGDLLGLSKSNTYGNSLFVVKNNGNVGINTTTPGFALSVKHTAFGTGMSVHLGMETNDCIMLQNTNVESTISSTNERFHLANNGANVITMYNGNVGIGNTTPTQKLDVFGLINASSGLCIAGNCKTSWATISPWSLSGSDVYYIGGNVGIGTPSPTADLEINGDLKVSGTIYSPGTVVQMVVKTSETISSLNVTDYTEASTDYRIDFTPKFSNSIILIEYTFPINAYMASNTIFDMQIIRNIGGAEVPVGVGPVNGNRRQVSFVGRPGNGLDVNDRNHVYMVAKDNGLTAGTTYTYGFKYRRETAGSGTCYFNYSYGDSDIYGFSGVMTIKVTEIAQ